MKIERKSIISGKVNVMNLDISEEQLRELKDPRGRLIQNVCPHLSDDEREFFLTGMMPEEWDNIFGEDEEIYDEDNQNG